MPDMNLNRIIRDTAKEIDSADPFVVSTAVIKKMSAKEVREALAITMPNYARIAMSVSQAVRSGNRAVRTGESQNLDRSKSAYIRRDAIDRALASSFYNKQTETYKPLKDCTADDLRIGAESRRHEAALNVAKAERYEELMNAMIQANARTVGDLSREVFAKAFFESEAVA
jgi:hypothetical protein